MTDLAERVQGPTTPGASGGRRLGVRAERPLDARLPVNGAVRTGRTVVQGTGPSRLAVSFGRSRAGELAADRLLAAAEAVGTSEDDVSGLLARPR